MAYDNQSARFADIMLAVKEQLGRVFNVEGELVRVVASDKYELYSLNAGNFGLYCRSYGPEPDTDGGPGRQKRKLKRLVRVYLYYRSALDQVGDDVTALTGDGAFHDLEDLLADCLDDFWPKDVYGKVLTVEPLHPVNSAEGPPLRREEDDIGQLRAHADFEVVYVSRNRTPAP